MTGLTGTSVFALSEIARTMRSQLICKICMDAPVNTIFLPCGHLGESVIYRHLTYNYIGTATLIPCPCLVILAIQLYCSPCTRFKKQYKQNIELIIHTGMFF